MAAFFPAAGWLRLLLLLGCLWAGRPHTNTDFAWDLPAFLGHAMYPTRGVQARLATSYGQGPHDLVRHRLGMDLCVGWIASTAVHTR